MGPSLIAAGQLEGVADGVAEVQDHPQPGVPLVRHDYLTFYIAAGIQYVFNFGHDFRPGGMGGQKERCVPDAAVFDDLRHAVGKGGVGQGIQRRRVHEHQFGLVEGSGQIFPRFQVNGHLAAHRRIHLGQQSGGDLDQVHPPQDGGCGKARQVPHHAAAQGHHSIGTGQAKGLEPLPEPGQLPGVLAVLPGGDGKQPGLEPGGSQALEQGLSIEGDHIAVADHRQLGRSGQRRPAALPRLGQQAPFDEDVVFPARQGHRECFHKRPPNHKGKALDLFFTAADALGPDQRLRPDACPSAPPGAGPCPSGAGTSPG